MRVSRGDLAINSLTVYIGGVKAQFVTVLQYLSAYSRVGIVGYVLTYCFYPVPKLRDSPYSSPMSSTAVGVVAAGVADLERAGQGPDPRG